MKGYIVTRDVLPTYFSARAGLNLQPDANVRDEPVTSEIIKLTDRALMVLIDNRVFPKHSESSQILVDLATAQASSLDVGIYLFCLARGPVTSTC